MLRSVVPNRYRLRARDFGSTPLRIDKPRRHHPNHHQNTKRFNYYDYCYHHFHSETTLEDLPTPAFVINRPAFQQNCNAVLETARRNNLKLRPHIKTHKTKEGAILQVGGGKDDGPSTIITGFVASTIPEVQIILAAAASLDAVKNPDNYNKFPDNTTPIRHCLNDILYAVPISRDKLKRLLTLRRSHRGARIHIMVDHPHQCDFIDQTMTTMKVARTAAPEEEEKESPISVFVKIDTGYHRAGVPWENTTNRGDENEDAIKLVKRIVESNFMTLYGLYSHCGHSYDVNEEEAIAKIAKLDTERMLAFRDRLLTTVDGIPTNLTLSLGSTPSLFHHTNPDNNENMEIHPGNYTLFDRQQLWSGAAKSEADIAGRVITTVIGSYKNPDRIMVDAGATAMTKEQTPQGGWSTIGGYPQIECYKMSQEMTLVRSSEGDNLVSSLLPLGSKVNMLPNHSCLSAACFDRYYIIDDPTNSFDTSQQIVDVWVPAKFF